jgi:hypothetical protein
MRPEGGRLTALHTRFHGEPLSAFVPSRLSRERQSSAAAAALNDKKLPKTNIAAAVGSSGWVGLPLSY